MVKTSKADRIYAGIGSRETPPEILDLMERIAMFLARRGVVLRSGGARGADSAFERGCKRANGRREIFLGELSPEQRVKIHTSSAYKVLLAVNPYLPHITRSQQVLIERDVLQILGADLATPVQRVVCWTPNGVAEGGTRYALAVAYDNDIQVDNLALPRVQQKWEQHLMEHAA